MKTLDAIANLTYVSQMKGNLEFAEKLQVNAIAFYKKVLGEKDPNTIGSMEPWLSYGIDRDSLRRRKHFWRRRLCF